MKHPLTSKERRGLVAVAAAALLCISSGFIVRNCGGISHADATPLSATSHEEQIKQDSISKAGSDRKATQKKKTKKTKAKTKNKKDYPTRDPLSQPCDE